MMTEPNQNYYHMRKSIQKTESKLLDLKYTVYLAQIKALNEAKRVFLLMRGTMA